MMVNDVMIVQTGSGLKNIGITTLQVTKGKITDRKYELVPLAGIKGTKPEVQAVIDKYNSNEEMRRVVAYAETAFANEEELGCMMTDAITARMKIDFAFQNGGGIRIPTLPQGNIMLKDIFRLDPFGLANDLGLIACLILVMLVAISSDAALRKLGPVRWKRWEQANYVAAVATAVHGALFQVLEKRTLALVLLFAVAGLAATLAQAFGARAVRSGSVR